jgi:uncharacterized protein YndB with AHSA1/START domain
MQPRGLLVTEGEYAKITFRRVYQHLIQHVWDAIATPEGLHGWLMCTHVRIEGKTGGQIELVSGPSGYTSVGKILSWEPPRVLEYEWNVEPVPEMPRGERAVFRFELTPIGSSTELVVKYRRITAQTARGFLPGMHVFLDRLEAQMDGEKLPNWMERFSEIVAKYPEWSGHAPDPGE